MNTSQFLDKQIMDLTSSSSATTTTRQSVSSSSQKQISNNSSSSNHKDFIDLINHDQQRLPQDDGSQSHHSNNDNSDDGIKRGEIVASYDFQPIRPIDSSITPRVWNSSVSDSLPIATAATATTTSPVRNYYGSMDSIEPAKVIMEKERNAVDASVTMSEIDKTMKKYSDNLLHVLEGVSARLTQLESRNHHLESSLDDLKVAVGNNHETSDGKMRQLESILREVQTGVEVLKDKQEIVESQLQLNKLHVSKADQHQLENQPIGQMDPVHQAASAPPQSHQQLPALAFPQAVPPVSIPGPPPVPAPPIPQTNLTLPPPLPKFPQSQLPPAPQRDPYYSMPGQSQETPNPQYQVPPSQQPQSSPAVPPHQSYSPAPQPQYPQPPSPHQPQPPLSHHSEETPFNPPQSYPPSLRPPSTQLPSGAPLSQPYYGAPSHMYEPPSSRPSSGFSAGYGAPPGPTEPYPYGGLQTQYGGNPTMKSQQLSSPAISQSGGSGYPQLPTARILPQALPTASGVGGGSGTSGTGNRVPLDDVVDNVTNMGFPREHVRATVRKLTQNGQSVDLNVVLDKLMNDGEIQPQRGWFGR